MQKLQENWNNLYYVPNPILFEIGKGLPVKDVMRLAITTKRFYKVFSDNAFWEHNFRVHYHKSYLKYKNQGIQDWYANFQKAYSIEKKAYTKLDETESELIMQVIFAVRDNDVEALKKVKDLRTALDIFELPDLNGWNILQTANNKHYNNVLEYLWQLIKKYQERESERFQTINGVPNKVSLETHLTLLVLAIACQRSPEEIRSRLIFLAKKNEYFTHRVFRSAYQFNIADKQICLVEAAIKYRNQEVINYFLDKNIKIKPYHLDAAIRNNDNDTLRILLSKIPARDKIKIVNDIKIDIPILLNHFDIVKLLFENGYYLKAGKKNSPLLVAIKKNADSEIIQYLLSMDNNFNLNDHGSTPAGVPLLLEACAEIGNYKLFKELIEKDTKNNFVTYLKDHPFIGHSIGFVALKAKQFEFLTQFLRDSQINPRTTKRIDGKFTEFGILDDLCKKEVLEDEEKETARILINNGFKPFYRSPLQYFLNNKATDSALLPIVYQQEIAKLQDYCKRRRADPREYYFIFFGKEFGFSSAHKIKAAETLIKLLKGECQDLSELNPSQWAALHQGELGNIYREIRTTAQIRKEEYTKLRPGIKV